MTKIKMKLMQMLPEGTVFVAFILTLLCLFAGTQRNLLDSANIMTLYTPEEGSSAHNFYSVHLMSYCQGTLGTIDPGVPGVTRNVTSCSSRTILFSFDPTQAWPKEITQGPALEWPRVISDDFQAFRLTSRAMAVLYCIAVVAMGGMLLVRVWAFLSPNKQQHVLELPFMLDTTVIQLGALSLSIASIIATVLAFEFVALINAHGKGSNVSAEYGDKFLGMTWAAVSLLIVGSAAKFLTMFGSGQQTVTAAPAKDTEEG
ncbi:Actin cortical patch SUR7/pH-response regulator PalI [Penicillium lagena]|uniref:Actin cortical patch SUR7/pH-response regulator PalI n=1 Tax=Penicillium lagena TaxID=94218 RepID=UPI002540C94B|nr:Actin cortical patch SUR7/pH-response regulator PalI [Penicillium lagena]KAJ5604733.1 Actin cortical patch SUR7/pH-response regulator PalI [Penicillium lagena]